MAGIRLTALAEWPALTQRRPPVEFRQLPVGEIAGAASDESADSGRNLKEEGKNPELLWGEGSGTLLPLSSPNHGDRPMTNISAETIALIAQAVAQALAGQQTSPKANNTQPMNGAAPRATQAERLAAKDRSLLSTFARRGFKDVVLLNRNDPTKPYNVRPFQAWINEGRLVRKGEHGVRGLFHISQTEPVTKAPAKPKEGPKVVAKKPAKARAAA